jgi:hypothetical protein
MGTGYRREGRTSRAGFLLILISILILIFLILLRRLRLGLRLGAEIGKSENAEDAGLPIGGFVAN